jgi:hypothetical protein
MQKGRFKGFFVNDKKSGQERSAEQQHKKPGSWKE